jgi:hypothetical protein
MRSVKWFPSFGFIYLHISGNVYHSRGCRLESIFDDHVGYFHIDRGEGFAFARWRISSSKFHLSSDDAFTDWIVGNR